MPATLAATLVNLLCVSCCTAQERVDLALRRIQCCRSSTLAAVCALCVGLVGCSPSPRKKPARSPPGSLSSWRAQARRTAWNCRAEMAPAAGRQAGRQAGAWEGMMSSVRGCVVVCKGKLGCRHWPAMAGCLKLFGVDMRYFQANCCRSCAVWGDTGQLLPMLVVTTAAVAIRTALHPASCKRHACMPIRLTHSAARRMAASRRSHSLVRGRRTGKQPHRLVRGGGLGRASPDRMC